MPGIIHPHGHQAGNPDQPGLFDESRPDPDRPKTTTGRDHPATSTEAARRTLPRSGTQRRRVLDALREVHPRGLTDEDLQARLGMAANTERPRRVELVRDGWAEDSGDRRDTAGGSPSIVWRYRPDHGTSERTAQ
jgi:hypothetical protein